MTESAVLILPAEDVHALEERRDPLVIEAHALEIRDQETFAYGAEFLVKVGDVKKAIVAGCDPVKRAAKSAHSAACDQERNLLAPVNEAEGIVKGRLNAYQREQAAKERKAREEQEAARRRHEAEQKKAAEEAQLRTAQELADAGLDEAADRVLEQPPQAPPPAPPPPAPVHAPKGKAAGVATKKVRKFEVTDLPALIHAVAAGEAPANVLQPNMTAIRALVRAHGDAFRVPGIRAWADEEVARTGR